MNPKMEIYIDIKGYGRDFIEKVTDKVSKDVLSLAKKIVAVRTGKLRTTIRRERKKLGEYIVYTDKGDAVYNFAQEYGRPDLGKYKYTPYMRPAAFQAGQPGNLAKHAIEASEEALRKNKRR